MVTESAIYKWQNTWKQLLDMAYHGKNITSSIFIQDSESEMLDLYVWSKNDPNFEKLTFEYMWKIYSQKRYDSGKYIEPKEVPELTHIYVSGTLFRGVGVSSFMKMCFPNCVISFWED